MKTTLSAEGQIALPAKLREQDRLRAGQKFAVERVENGAYLLRKLSEPEETDLVDWLLACPVKGYFQSIPSESTNSL